MHRFAPLLSLALAAAALAQSTPPTGVSLGGSVDNLSLAGPNVLVPNGVVELSVLVRPGTNPPSTNIQVEMDLRAVQGPASVLLKDDGLYPDAVAGDHIFTAMPVIRGNGGNSFSPQQYIVPFTVRDAQQRSSTGSQIVMTYAHKGACCVAGSCTLQYGEACLAASGRWLGPDTVCAGPMYRLSESPIAFTDLSVGGTELVGFGNTVNSPCAMQVNLPFTFSFFGAPFTSVMVTTEGMIDFHAAATAPSCSVFGIYLDYFVIPHMAYSPEAASVFNGRVSVYGQVFYSSFASNPGRVYTRTDGVAPNRRFIISWQNWMDCLAEGRAFNNFQAVLHEGSNAIDLVYGSLTPQVVRDPIFFGYPDNLGSDGTHLVGIEDATGLAGIRIPSYSLYRGNTARTLTPVVSLIPCCTADFNSSGAVTVQDIFDFLSEYFAGGPRADINGAGGLSVQDIFDFLAAYFAGC